MLDPYSLFFSLVIGSIGFGLFVYGKKQTRFPHLFAGIALMVYPYFIDSVRWQAAVGGLILFVLWYVVRIGW